MSVDVSEPVAATYTVLLDKPEALRLKDGQTIVLPYTVSVERGYSNLRALCTENGFHERPYTGDRRNDPTKTAHLIIVTVSVIRTP